MKKKVVFLTSRLPLPTDDGRSITLNQYLNSLSKYCDVYLVSLKGKKKIENQSKNLKMVQEIDYPKFAEKIYNVLTKSFFGGAPLQVSGVYSKKSQKRFDTIIDNIKPDIIICDMIRTSLYVKKNKFKCTRVLDMDDILSNRYKISIGAKEDALGQFKEMLPPVFLKVISMFRLNKLILKFESKRMKKSELKAINYFDKIILVSPKETETFKVEANTDKVYTWPICVKTNERESVSFCKNQICFLGNMEAAQNQTTLRYLYENIFQKLPSNFELIVIGKCSELTRKVFSNYERVKFIGYVDDVSTTMKMSLCLLAPILYGSGIKIKILDAMSCGVPVVTTPIGAEGINVTNSVDILINLSPDEFVTSIMKLYNSEAFRKNISNNAIKYIRNNHSLELGDKFVEKHFL